MEAPEIRARLLSLMGAMERKGYPRPGAALTFWGYRPEEESVSVSLTWFPGKMVSFRGEFPREAIETAAAAIFLLPDYDPVWREDFDAHVRKAVDIAVRNIPDADTIGRLRATADDLAKTVAAWSPASKAEAA